MADPGSTISTSERQARIRRRRTAPPTSGEDSATERDGAGAESLLVLPDQKGAGQGTSRRTARVAVALLVAGDAVALALGLLAGRPLGVQNWIYLGAALLALSAASSHRLRISLSALDDAPRLAMALAVAVLVVTPFAWSVHETLLRQALASVLAVVAMRAAVYAVIRRARRRGFTERTLIAGTGHVGIELAQLMQAHPEYGLGLAGFVGVPFPNLPAPLLGGIAHLDEVVTRHGIRRVLVAFGPTREAELVGVLRTAVLRDIEVYVVPRFFEVGVAPRGPDVDDLWGIPVYRVRQAALRAGPWHFKRALDIGVASVLLAVTAPVMALAAVLVKLSSPGPVLFRQRRIGQHGEEIEVLKFRTLPAGHVDNRWNASDTEYRNPIGRFLRRLSVDELPQLWNVLRGDMSLVGPRPERGYLVEQFNSSIYGYRDRHRLPVGLTGWAQVHGLRGETSLRERVRFDNQYIEHWSLWRDLVIIIRTASTWFRGPHEASEPDPVLRPEPQPAPSERDEQAVAVSDPGVAARGV